LGVRVFANFRRHMWPILGQTTLDTLRVIDWAIATFGILPQVAICGISMGGDIAVAAAGLDGRIRRVAAIVATPDWLRPDMRHVANPQQVLPAGEPDVYAQFFYDQMNPMTHLDSYAGGPEILFVCGEHDTHVPPDGAVRFQAALRERHPSAAERVQIKLIEGMDHIGAGHTELWWPECLAWLTRS
jgi:dienelactone hydrolase